MALYKYSHYLTRVTDPRFDPALEPGTIAPHCGIYQCQGCGHEIASNAGNSLPPADHHEHEPEQGALLWRLIVSIEVEKGNAE
jgi:hypothetical protein